MQPDTTLPPVPVQPQQQARRMRSYQNYQETSALYPICEVDSPDLAGPSRGPPALSDIDRRRNQRSVGNNNCGGGNGSNSSSNASSIKSARSAHTYEDALRNVQRQTTTTSLLTMSDVAPARFLPRPYSGGDIVVEDDDEVSRSFSEGASSPDLRRGRSLDLRRHVSVRRKASRAAKGKEREASRPRSSKATRKRTRSGSEPEPPADESAAPSTDEEKHKSTPKKRRMWPCSLSRLFSMPAFLTRRSQAKPEAETKSADMREVVNRE